MCSRIERCTVVGGGRANMRPAVPPRHVCTAGHLHGTVSLSHELLPSGSSRDVERILAVFTCFRTRESPELMRVASHAVLVLAALGPRESIRNAGSAASESATMISKPETGFSACDAVISDSKTSV